jgi:hypothetical protein
MKMRTEGYRKKASEFKPQGAHSMDREQQVPRAIKPRFGMTTLVYVAITP